jgi:hypothetical protein
MDVNINTEMMFCTRDATTEELLGDMFSMMSVPRCFKQEKYRVQLVVRQSPASKDVNTEAEGSTVLEAFTKQLMKTQQNEKT